MFLSKGNLGWGRGKWSEYGNGTMGRERDIGEWWPIDVPFVTQSGIVLVHGVTHASCINRKIGGGVGLNVILLSINNTYTKNVCTNSMLATEPPEDETIFNYRLVFSSLCMFEAIGSFMFIYIDFCIFASEYSWPIMGLCAFWNW